MPSMTSSFLSTLAYVAAVAAHGHISAIVVNGVSYEGYDSPAHYSDRSGPNVFGWTIDQRDNGFVSHSNLATDDIICHRAAENAQSHVKVAAGDTLNMQWNIWPASHHGPVVDYLANCNGPCEKADKKSLEFFKIGELGQVEPSPKGSYTPGKFAADILVNNGFTWNVNIPKDIAPGNYVLRHEIIALHPGAGLAEFYPQCFNLEITGSGSAKPAGVKGTELYKDTDPGIQFDIYGDSQEDYIIPGPRLIEGVTLPEQNGKAPSTSSANATPAGESGPASTSGSSDSNDSNPPAGGSDSNSGDKPAGDSGSNSGDKPAGDSDSNSGDQPAGGSCRLKESSGATANSDVALWGKCGGKDYQGSTSCTSGSTCVVVNEWYSQCQPPNA